MYSQIHPVSKPKPTQKLLEDPGCVTLSLRILVSSLATAISVYTIECKYNISSPIWYPDHSVYKFPFLPTSKTKPESMIIEVSIFTPHPEAWRKVISLQFVMSQCSKGNLECASYTELNCVFPKDISNSWPLVPLDVTLRGHRVFAEVIKLELSWN